MSEEKKVEVKKEETVKVSAPELTAIDKKVEDIQKNHAVAVKNKQNLIQQLKSVDEAIVKLVGGYQSLMELKAELTADKKPEDTKPEEAEASKEEECKGDCENCPEKK